MQQSRKNAKVEKGFSFFLVVAWCITPTQGGRVIFQGEHQARRIILTMLSI
jgi:hypothetical protein